MLEAMMFTIVWCGYEPRIASEDFDSLQIRMEKIKALIRDSKFSIHDLSRMNANKKGEIPRFNMPFEIGVDYGCRVYGDRQHRTKKCLILAEKRYAYQKALSDLSGVDIAAHNSSERLLVERVRNWIRSSLTSKIIDSASVIWKYYNEFTGHFGMSMLDRGFKKRDIASLPSSEFLSYIKSWVKDKRAYLKRNP